MYSVSSVVSQTAIMKTVIIEDKQRIESIILHCDACFVGITDLEGNPYVVPMNFGYENGIIYLHSGPEGSKWEMSKWKRINGRLSVGYYVPEVNT